MNGLLRLLRLVVAVLRQLLHDLDVVRQGAAVGQLRAVQVAAVADYRSWR